MDNSEAKGLTVVLPVAARARMEQKRAEMEIAYAKEIQRIVRESQPGESATPKIEALLIQYVDGIFSIFAEEVVNSRYHDTLAARKLIEAYFPIAIDKAFLEKHPSADTIDRASHRGRFHYLAKATIKNSDGWIAMQQALSERAGIELQEIETATASGSASTAEAPAEMSRVAMRDAYFAKFKGERIIIRDFCWAAGQHYCDWKKWLRKNSPLKDGSAPDIAFRDILLSGKRPHEYRTQLRPDGWE